MKKTKLTTLLGGAVALLLTATTASAAVVSIVGSRSEMNSIETGFNSFGDTVVRYNTSWSALSSAQLDSIFSSDIVWESDIFVGIPAAVQTRMGTYVNNNGGLFLTAERSCCETHNDSVQAVGRALTGDNGLLIGDLGFDLNDHVFSPTPSTILTDPNDITGQPALHNGPGRVEPTGGVGNNACFTISKVSAAATTEYCTAAAFGPDVLQGALGRLVIYGDVNSQPSLVSSFGGDQFENIRSFLLAGFTGGVDVCDSNPNLPGCPGTGGNNGGGSVPVPGTVLLLGLGLLGVGSRRWKRKG